MLVLVNPLTSGKFIAYIITKSIHSIRRKPSIEFKSKQIPQKNRVVQKTQLCFILFYTG